MKIRPNQWTHHHTHRLFHLSVLMVALTFIISSAWVFSSSMGTVYGSDSMQADSGTSLRVVAIGEGTTTVVPGGGSSDPTNPPSNVKPVPLPLNNKLPYVIVVPAEQPGYQFTEQTSDGPRYIFNTQYPKFIGSTNIKNAKIKIELTGQVLVRANVIADSDGNWQWQSSVPLAPGNHTLTAVATDPLEPRITAQIGVLLRIQLPAHAKVEYLPVIRNTPDQANSGTLFDVLVDIPQKFKKLVAGNEVISSIKLINFGSAGKPVNMEVGYVIRNSANEIILQTFETVAVATQLSFLKTFYTSSALPSGLYSITVTVPSKGLIVSATDIFELQQAVSQPIPTALASTSSPLPLKYTIVFIMLGIMMSLGIMIAYWEYNKVTLLSQRIKQLTEHNQKK